MSKLTILTKTLQKKKYDGEIIITQDFYFYPTVVIKDKEFIDAVKKAGNIEEYLQENTKFPNIRRYFINIDFIHKIKIYSDDFRSKNVISTNWMKIPFLSKLSKFNLEKNIRYTQIDDEFEITNSIVSLIEKLDKFENYVWNYSQAFTHVFFPLQCVWVLELIILIHKIHI